MIRPIPEATERTAVLLVHAPYPGRLKFDGLPSSLLHAIAPFAASGAAEDLGAPLGFLDPGTPSPAFYARLGELAAGGRLRAVCISTSTAAIEETARIVRLIRDVAGDEILVVVGGPHEDDCEEKVAVRLAGVDLSIGGDAEHVLEFALREYLERDATAEATCRRLEREFGGGGSIFAGAGTVTSPWWEGERTRTFSFRSSADDAPLPATIEKDVSFPVFRARWTLPVMISRGCAYGRCTFCAEGARGEGQLVRQDFAWLEVCLEEASETALYFQDSIFPNNAAVRERLLPMLRAWGGEWGCQVYLRALSRQFLGLLAAHGCSYVYTGLETASADILAAVGKTNMNREVALERFGWMRAEGLRAGISLMFGSMSTAGAVLETEETIDETVGLAQVIAASGLRVVGFYPNVQTVLPGTALARGLAAAGHDLDFYRVPRCVTFDGLEDGGVGYNFMTIPTVRVASKDRVAERIAAAAAAVQRLGTDHWDPTAGVICEKPLEVVIASGAAADRVGPEALHGLRPYVQSSW